MLLQMHATAILDVQEAIGCSMLLLELLDVIHQARTGSMQLL